MLLPSISVTKVQELWRKLQKDPKGTQVISVFSVVVVPWLEVRHPEPCGQTRLDFCLDSADCLVFCENRPRGEAGKVLKGSLPLLKWAALSQEWRNFPSVLIDILIHIFSQLLFRMTWVLTCLDDKLRQKEGCADWTLVRPMLEADENRWYNHGGWWAMGYEMYCIPFQKGVEKVKQTWTLPQLHAQLITQPKKNCCNLCRQRIWAYQAFTLIWEFRRFLSFWRTLKSATFPMHAQMWNGLPTSWVYFQRLVHCRQQKDLIDAVIEEVSGHSELERAIYCVCDSWKMLEDFCFSK